MAISGVEHPGCLGVTGVLRYRAPGGKQAGLHVDLFGSPDTARDATKVGDRPCVRGRLRNTLQQPCGVGMFWGLEQIANRRLLDGLPRIHHRHVIGDARDRTQVVTHI